MKQLLIPFFAILSSFSFAQDTSLVNPNPAVITIDMEDIYMGEPTQVINVDYDPNMGLPIQDLFENTYINTVSPYYWDLTPQYYVLTACVAIEIPECGEEYHENGQLSYKNECKDSVLHGMAISWNEEGDKISESKYEEGKLLYSLRWNDKGQKIYESRSKNGELDWAAAWNNNGIMSYKYNYKNGKMWKYVNWLQNGKVGTVNYYYSNGRYAKTINRHENGRISRISHYDWFGNEHGLAKSWYDNGNIQEHYTIVNGIRHGKAINGNWDGKSLVIYHYKNGVLDGMNEEWYDGKIRASGEYVEGEKVGRWRRIDFNDTSKVTYTDYKDGGQISEEVFINGRLASSKQMVRGRLQGNWKRYTESGLLCYNFSYDKGEQAGTQYEYYENGNLKRKYNVHSNKLYGTNIHIYEDSTRAIIQLPTNPNEALGFNYVERLVFETNGDTLRQEWINNSTAYPAHAYVANHYKNGLRSGTWQFTYLDQPLKKMTYLKGVPHGSYEYHYPKFCEFGQMKDGKKHGAELRYADKMRRKEDLYSSINYSEGLKSGYSHIYINGMLHKFSTYSNDSLNGKYKEYYFNSGQLKSTGVYENDLRQANWQSYHRDGAIESHGDYLNGKEIGEWVYYYSGKFNRVKKAEGKMLDGEKVGRWKYYSKEGKVINRINHTRNPELV